METTSPRRDPVASWPISRWRDATPGLLARQSPQSEIFVHIPVAFTPWIARFQERFALETRVLTRATLCHSPD
jgi:hypothetical protein